MLRLDDLRGSVELATGSVAFSLALGGLPGMDEAGISLAAAYDGNVGAVARAPNVDAPTGVLGLGWRLGIERIVALLPPGAATADPVYALERADGSRLRLRALAASGDTVTYVTDPYEHWTITRSLSTERWDVVREDGRRWIYGESGSGRETVELGVRWGDFGGSSVAAGQQRYALAWNLSRVVDLWGNACTLTYRQVTETVGADGLAYTQATYLDRVDGPAGDAAVFAYLPKTAAEYQDPHGAPAPPNAWQDRYEREYLDAIELRTPLDLRQRVRFLYTDGAGRAVFLGSGTLTKRLLTGVAIEHERAPGQLAPATIPPTRFTYVMDASAPAYGSIASVTTAEGGTTAYEYAAAATDLPLCQRALALTPPSMGDGVTCSAPRFWFGEDHVVVSWLCSDGRAAIATYAWAGRWIPSLAGTLPVAGAAAYAALTVALGGDAILAVAGSRCLPCRWDPLRLAFVAPAAALTLDLTAGEAVELAAGTSFAAVLGTQSGRLNRLRWDGAAWALDTVVLGSGAGALRCALDASDAALVTSWTDGAAATDALHVRLDRYAPTCAWEAHETTLPRPAPLVGALAVHGGDACAVVVASTGSGSQALTSYRAVQWSPAYAVGGGALLATVAGSAAPVPALRGSLVAIGTLLCRFDGSAWTRQDVGPAAAIDCGADQALCTFAGSGGASTYSAFTYDPNATGTSRWSAPANLDGIAPGAGAFAARAARSDAGGSRWLLMPATGPSANALWHQGPDGAWTLAARIPDTLTAAELPSLQLLGERCCVYQSGTSTRALVLEGESVTVAPALTGEQLLVAGRPPDLLVGTGAFVTYTGAWGEAQSVLRLHRPIRGAVAGPLSAVPVASLTQGTGYEALEGANGTLRIATEFRAVNATLDAGGWTPLYNLAEVAEGATATTRPYGVTQTSRFNGLTAAEMAAAATALVPAPPSGADADVAAEPGLYAGLTYNSQALPSGSATPVSQLAEDWIAIAPEAGQYALRYARAGAGRHTVDGVTLTLARSWNPGNGLPSSETTTSYDGSGQLQATTTVYRYFFEQYQHPELHLLDAVVQRTESAGTTPFAIEIETWSNAWDPSGAHWAPYERYLATTAQPAAFNRWEGGSAALAAGWLLQERIAARTTRGAVQRTVDATGFVQSAIFDRDAYAPVAAFAGADTAALQAGFYGFERYEADPRWSYAGGRLEALIVEDDAHSGSRCLRFPQSTDGAGGPIATWAGGARRYVFSCWMRTPAGSDAEAATARWEVYLEGEATPAQTLAFPRPGGWTFVWTEIDLTAKSPPVAQVTIRGVNRSNAEVYVDELRYAPLDASGSATVYDPSVRRVVAQLADNGVTQRTVTDASGRAVAQVGSGDAVQLLAGTAFSQTIGGAGFDPAQPNVVTAIAPTSSGTWMGFGRGDAAAWTLPAGWAVAEWRLRFGGRATDPAPPFGTPAVLTSAPLTNLAARVRFEPGAVLRGAGIGLGNLIVSWDESEQGWILGCKDGTGQWSSVAIRRARFGVEWMLAIVDRLVLFWADGNPVFAYPMTQVVPSGALSLYAADPCAFAALAVTPEPRISLAFSDGAGQLLQQLDLADGATALVTGAFSDPLRREVVSRTPVSATLQIPAPPAYPAPARPEQGRVTAGPATYLLGDGALAGDGALSIPQYLALVPPPFAQQQFDASPVGRLVRGAPAGTQIASAQATTFAYAQHTATDAMAGLGYDASAAQYQLQTATDPDGVATYTLCNALGQVLARRVRTSGGTAPAYATTQCFYDAAGRPVKELPPNAFAGSVPDDRWATTTTYTFPGQPATRTTQDEGQAQLNYDELGRLRFQLDAAGAALMPQRIVYFAYDALGRLVETGTIQDAQVVFAAIPQYAPYTLPSGVVPAWQRRLAWDRNAEEPQEPNLAGRLWRVQTASGASVGAVDVQTFSYDRRGLVVRQRDAVAGYGATTYETAYRHEVTGALIETTYPRPLANGKPVGDPFTVGRYFDRLGQLVGVGQGSTGTEVFDPENPITDPSNHFAETYARFEYDVAGRLARASYDNAGTAPIARSWTRDPASSLLREIGGDFHRETIAYGSGGWAGRVASAAHEVSLLPGDGTDGFLATPLAAGTWTYAYDALQRLLSATASGDASDASLDLGSSATPIAYDANGNLTSVPRPGLTESYAYASGADRLASHGASAAVAQSFAAPLPPGWSWGASNGGPSASAIVDSGAGAGKALRLAGGGPGHAEQLAYRGALDPQGSYELRYEVKGDAGFAAQAGSAGWYLQLFTSAGEAVRLPLSDASAAGTSWTAVGPVTIDLPALAAGAGLSEPLIAGGLLLVNGKRGDAGPGAALLVTGISLTGSASAALTYDANGDVIAAAGLGLREVTYEPVGGRTSAIVLPAGREAQRIAYAYGPSGRRTLATVAFAEGATQRTLSLRDPRGRLLMRRLLSDGAETVTAFLDGPDGIFAQRSGEAVSYLLRDHLGSLRAVVAGGRTLAWLDYGPYGELRHAGAAAPPERFAGYEADAVAQLLDLGARLYDPRLRRFLQVDPLGRDPAGYAYAAGDPIGMVDPDGEYPIRLLLIVLGWTLLSQLLVNLLSSVGDPEASAAGVARDTVSDVAGGFAATAIAALVHDAAVHRRVQYTSASLGSSLAGAVVVAGGGAASDAVRCLVRALLGDADAWAAWGWEDATFGALRALTNHVLLGGGFHRILPSHNGFEGSFEGPPTGGPLGLWRPGWVRVPAGEVGGATTQASREAMHDQVTHYCHTCGVYVDRPAADHTPGNAIYWALTPQGITLVQRYYPHCRECYSMVARLAWRQIKLMAGVRPGNGGFTFAPDAVYAVPHGAGSFRLWRLTLHVDLPLQLASDHPVPALVLLGALYTYRNLLGLGHWWSTYRYWYWR